MPDNKTKYGIDDIVEFNTEDENDKKIICYGVITEIRIAKDKEPEYTIINKEPDYINESDVIAKVGQKGQESKFNKGDYNKGDYVMYNDAFGDNRNGEITDCKIEKGKVVYEILVSGGMKYNIPEENIVICKVKNSVKQQ